MDQWLIRTHENIIAGPYGADQVRQLILDGQLSRMDEVCRASNFWFYLYEKDELKSQLGIDLPAHLEQSEPDEEITNTATQTVPTETSTPPSPSSGPEAVGGTMVLTSQRSKQSKSDSNVIIPAGKKKNNGTTPELSDRKGLSSKVENASFWKGLIWVLLTVACLLIVAVLRLVRTL